ncbi:MAG TPA: type II toxin-antitoxin system VapC family toxin [Rhizomicrobium sp.]|nr:type II toxin-antitoxin system VapC family toxin [Rhizomicrobium sp.]
MNPRFLLDSCAIIYIVEQQRMKRVAAETIGAASATGNSLFVSPITAWEFGMLFAKGRLRASVTMRDYWDRVVAIKGVNLALMPPEVLMASWSLPGNIHGDPWDRIIAATAREYGFTVMTRDRALLDYAREGHLSALEC